MVEFFQQLANGIAAGSIYALVAVGYTLVFGVLELINFAHGDIMMVSTFVTVAAVNLGASWALAVFLGLAAGAVLGLLVERFAYRPLRGADRMAPTVTAVGAALVLENAAQLIWGPQTNPFPGTVDNHLILLGGAIFTVFQLIILVVAACMAGLLFIIVQYSQWGRYMRAIRDDLPTAELVGISVNRIVAFIYALGSVLGVVGGILFAAYYNAVYVGMGFAATMNAFVAAVLGGIGSLKGAFVGGLLLGVLQALAVGYIASGYENTVSFVVMIAVLIIRPAGLFGRPQVSRV